jgi:hypothetical protein
MRAEERFLVPLQRAAPFVNTRAFIGTNLGPGGTYLRLELGAGGQTHFFRPAFQLDTTTICV